MSDSDEYDCDSMNIPHEWTDWEIGPYFPREERFCLTCGIMETQEIR